MTLRLRKHFTTCAIFLALIFGLTPVNFLRPVPVGARISTASGSERGSINGPAAKTTLAIARGTDQGQNKEQKPQTEPMLRIETDLVQIDLVVADKAGKLMRDLRREDFELFEDGKKQQITHFAIGTAVRPALWLPSEKKSLGKEVAVAPATTPAAITAEVKGGRHIVLAVDDFHLEPKNLLLVKQTLLRFINQQMVSGDQVAITTTSGTLGFSQQFTSERAALGRAVNRIGIQNREVVLKTDVFRISDYQAELIDRGDRDALELALREVARARGEESPAPYGQGRLRGSSIAAALAEREKKEQEVKSLARKIVEQNTKFTRVTLSTLESLVRSLRPLPGRKVVALVSDGFLLGGPSASARSEMARITDAATRSGVVIYSIDARGLIAEPPGGNASKPAAVDLLMARAQERIERGAIEAKRDGMNALAADTGGLFLFNRNDLNLGLQRVLDDNETYYLLAYEPPESRRDGRFHKIEVRVANRPGLTVRTRKGYLSPEGKEVAKEKPKAKSPEQAAKAAEAEKAEQFRSALSSPVRLREIPVELSADFVDLPEHGSSALLNAHIRAAGLSYESSNDRRRVALDVMVTILDESGKEALNFGERLDLSLRQDTFEQIAKHGLGYRKAVLLKPGFYQARIAAREDGTARIGTATKWIEIPDLGNRRLALSGVWLSPAGAPLDVLPGMSEKTGGYQPRPAQVANRFSRGGEVDFLVFAYNAKVVNGATSLVIKSQIYSGDKPILATAGALAPAPGVTDLQRLPYAARLSLGGLRPGDYELRLTVLDNFAQSVAERRVNFTIE